MYVAAGTAPGSMQGAAVPTGAVLPEASAPRREGSETSSAFARSYENADLQPDAEPVERSTPPRDHGQLAAAEGEELIDLVATPVHCDAKCQRKLYQSRNRMRSTASKSLGISTGCG